MTVPPPGDGGPAEGTPEYDWLYGPGRRSGQPGAGAHRSSPYGDDATRAVEPGQGGRSADATRPVPRQAPPEETRVMEVQPPSQSSALSRRGTRAGRPGSRASTAERATTPPTPPPVAPPPAQTSRPRRRPRFRMRYVWLLLFLWLVYLLVVPMLAWRAVPKVDASPGGERPAEQPGTTYLLVGSDSRAGLSKEEREALHTGGAAGQRTDTIMLLHIGAGPNLLMSIPRDSLVPIPGHGTTKINAAYAFGGPKLLVRTVEMNTGIRVDHFVEIGFGGFVGLVDAVGGIEICPKKDMVDTDAGLDIKAGCQEVDGEVALAYARSRHAQQLGDLDRAANQREVVAAVGSEAVSPWTVVNPVRYWQLNFAAADAVAVDEEMGPIDAARFALAMTRVDGENGLTCGVPISDLAVHWDPERSEQMFRRIIEDNTATIGKRLCTASGLPR